MSAGTFQDSLVFDMWSDYGTGIEYGIRGGPMYQDKLERQRDGTERIIPFGRDDDWQLELEARNVTEAQKDYVLAFFATVRGRRDGFRLLNPIHYKATEQAQTVDGSPTIQLVDALGNNISKPVSGSDSMKRGVSDFSDYTLDTETGIATLNTADASDSIEGITQAANGVVSATAHPFSNGDVLYYSGVAGMTEINGLTGTVSGATADAFNSGIDTSEFSAYSSGGTASKYIQPSESLTATFQFHLPVRFNIRQPVFEFIGRQGSKDIFRMESIPLVLWTGAIS